ncbi:MAG: hypothetical protein WD738_16890 [Pirellulales bacterium]
MSARTATSLLTTLAVLATALVAVPVCGATKGNDHPRIVDCRVGFDGQFKVGFWTPIWVAVAGDVARRPVRVEATTIDSDGVHVSVSAPLETGGDSAEGIWPVLLYTKVGRIAAPIHVTLFSDDDTVLDRFELSPNTEREKPIKSGALPATSELIVQLGTSDLGLEDAYHEPETGVGGARRAFVRLSDVDALPTDWFGYEAVDVLVLASSDVDLMRKLVADRRRFEALRQWLELGGRLMIFCGGDDSQAVLGDGGPLAALAPGKLAEVVRLPETGPLEHFASSEAIAAGGTRVSIRVPRLVDVDGKIEVYGGRRSTYLPLVVRTARGLGEVAFIGVDLGKTPLSEWSGRKAFLQAALGPYLQQGDEGAGSQSLVIRGYNDLSGALRQRLGQSFEGVTPITFPVVTVLAIAYLLMLGPLDYLLVHRWLRRPWVAWVSFPLIVLVFGLAAIALADWRRPGAESRVNQLELVDIDTVTGQARGTFWAALYSPRAQQFDLGLDVELPSGSAEPAILVSWWGLPGVGIGGMQSGGSEPGIVRGGYRYGAGLDSLVEVPVLTSSTKSLLARWTAPVAPLIDSQLADQDGLVAGSIENRSGVPLRNVRLLYNGWGYRLGNLEPGRRIDVSEEISPRRVKTIVTQDALGAATRRADGNAFVAHGAKPEAILSLMTFYEAAGGIGFAQLPNRYQDYCDLSRMLELGRAVLIADVPGKGSRLVDGDSGVVLGNEQVAGAVVYRFVLPVRKEEKFGVGGHADPSIANRFDS